jgi:hypothetical protein
VPARSVVLGLHALLDGIGVEADPWAAWAHLAHGLREEAAGLLLARRRLLLTPLLASAAAASTSAAALLPSPLD